MLKNFINKWIETNLILKILIGIIIGTILGLFIPQLDIGILGVLFITALKAIAPFLVFIMVITALSGLNRKISKNLKTCIVLYVCSMLLACFVAVIFSFIYPTTVTFTTAATSSAPTSIGEVLNNLLTSMVSNPLTALVEGNYICILFWAVILGLIAKSTLSDNTKKMLDEFSKLMIKCVKIIIQFAPIGIMGLVFTTVSKNGLGIFSIYGHLILLVVGSILIVAFITDPLIVALVLKRNPYPLVLTCLRESGITAFFTRSSAANIPINLELCEKLGLDSSFYSVSIPLGATINMEGAAITITVMTLALCHTLGVGVSIPTALLLCIIATIAACGVSAVPNGSLLLIPTAAALFGIGLDAAMLAVGVGFILAVVNDSFETALNSSGDAIFSATSTYYHRKKEGKALNFLGKFSK